MAGIDVIYEDRHLLVVNKPARIGVGSDASGDRSLLELVRDYYYEKRQAQGKEGKGYLVPIHFLDRPVSGVVVFASSSKAAERINSQFASRKVEKKYVAIVEKAPSACEAVLINSIAKDHAKNISKLVPSSDSSGKKSELAYKVLKNLSRGAMLEVKPKTGRSHQIRVQLAGVGCPIFGDTKYGASSNWQKRIALHAAELRLIHPTSRESILFKAELPDAFEELM